VKTEETEKNLAGIITKAKGQGIKVILAGMKMPPNYGKEFTEKFGKIFPALAKKHHLTFIPFILEGVASDPKLNLPDGIHPNPDGHKIMAKTVLKYLRPEL
jgi:acyl-CoA thioesterase-1